MKTTIHDPRFTGFLKPERIAIIRDFVEYAENILGIKDKDTELDVFFTDPSFGTTPSMSGPMERSLFMSDYIPEELEIPLNRSNPMFIAVEPACPIVICWYLAAELCRVRAFLSGRVSGSRSHMLVDGIDIRMNLDFHREMQAFGSSILFEYFSTASVEVQNILADPRTKIGGSEGLSLQDQLSAITWQTGAEHNTDEWAIRMAHDPICKDLIKAIEKIVSEGRVEGITPDPIVTLLKEIFNIGSELSLDGETIH